MERYTLQNGPRAATCGCTAHVVAHTDFSAGRRSFKAHGHLPHSVLFARSILRLARSCPSSIPRDCRDRATSGVCTNIVEHVPASRPWSHAAIGRNQRKPIGLIGRFAGKRAARRSSRVNRTRVPRILAAKFSRRGELARALCIVDLVGALTVVLDACFSYSAFLCR